MTAAEGLQWLESHPQSDAEDVEGKQKELESNYNRIMKRVYQEAGVNPDFMNTL